MDDTKPLSDLHKNVKNPRRISEHDFAALQESIKKFGDLSGIVFNVRSSQLVGGHRRKEAFERLGGESHVTITQRLAQPDDVGTVAYGYIIWNGKQYAYREVDWDENRELAANIAANRIQGEWDLDLLAEANAQLYQNEAGLLALTGQTEEELEKILGDSGILPQPEAAPYEAPRSLPGVTYKLGAHTITCATVVELGNIPDSIGGVGFVDDIRRMYAKLIGKDAEWEAATPAIQNAPTATQTGPETAAQA